MKKLIFPIVCCFISMTVSAQLVKQQAETQKKQSELDWFNCSFDKDSVSVYTVLVERTVKPVQFGLFFLCFCLWFH